MPVEIGPHELALEQEALMQIDHARVLPPRQACCQEGAWMPRFEHDLVAEPLEACDGARHIGRSKHEIEVGEDAPRDPLLRAQGQDHGSLQEQRIEPALMKRIRGLAQLGRKPAVPLDVALEDHPEIGGDVVGNGVAASSKATASAAIVRLRFASAMTLIQST
jgi:hypothetical protein